MEFETPLPSWVVWEALGHKVVVGYAVEGEIAGTKVVQIGIPGKDRGTFAARPNLAPGSLYCVTVIDEERARQMNGLDRAPLLQRGVTMEGGFDLPDVQDDDGEESDDDGEESDGDDEYITL